jgi:N-methylhydantoinase A
MCFDKDRGFEDTAVYKRSMLPTGFEIRGPAIIEQLDTTTLVYDQHVARVDTLGNLIIDVPDGD